MKKPCDFRALFFDSPKITLSKRFPGIKNVFFEILIDIPTEKVYDDITGDILNVKKLKRLKERLNDLRRKGGIKSSEVESLAKVLGRVRHHTRGKEPTWINKEFQELRPLTIPHHSTDLNRFTAASILDQLEGDIEKYEETLETKREVT